MKWHHIFLPVLSVLIVSYVYKDSLPYLYPYLKLINGDRQSTVAAWKSVDQIDRRIVYPATPIPEIAAKDYSYEVFMKATKNGRLPAVVRGLFNGTKALELWPTREYLPKVFEGVDIPVVKDGRIGTLQDDRVVQSFATAFREVFDSDYDKKYLFFPVKSRFMFNGSDAGSAEALQNLCTKIAISDLELNRLFNRFGTKTHKAFIGSQFVIGKSTDSFSKESTGSDWHCAVGNNYFVQLIYSINENVAGRKKWEFIEPKFSHYLWPLKGGVFNFWTGNKEIASTQKHIPRYYVVLEPGDVIYNPVWMWHKITNYGGLSIGVPIREMNPSGMKNNMFFSFIVFSNKFLSDFFGISYNGYPLATTATEADN